METDHQVALTFIFLQETVLELSYQKLKLDVCFSCHWDEAMQCIWFPQIEEDEKLKKRKERFGILTSASPGGAEDAEVLFHLVHLSGQVWNDDTSLAGC